MTMTAEGVSPHWVQSTIFQLRYWVPSIKDVAHIEESGEDGAWTLSIYPRVPSACPVAVRLKDSGRFDLWVAGETYADRTFGTLEQLVTLLERITEGAVVQRRWISAQTGAHYGTETIVSLTPEKVWRDGAEGLVADGTERRDRHFLPYRRM